MFFSLKCCKGHFWLLYKSSCFTNSPPGPSVFLQLPFCDKMHLNYSVLHYILVCKDKLIFFRMSIKCQIVCVPNMPFFQEQKKSLSHVRVNVCWYMFAGPYNVTATRTPQSIKKEMVHLFCINLTHSTIRLMQPTLLHTFKTAVFIC